jgi:hypothetical protein
MEKPDTGESWWGKLFGGGTTTKPTPPPIITGKPSSSTGSSSGSKVTTIIGPLSTTYAKDSSTLLQQLREALKYKSFIEEAARLHGFQPSIICGVGSRESHWGLALKPPGPKGRGDFARRRPKGDRYTAEPPDGPGYGRGLMQIDYDSHEFARTNAWTSPRDNILYGGKVLSDARLYLTNRIDLNTKDLLRGILAAYNGGAGNALKALQAGRDVDTATTGGDYSRDVLNRSGWFQLHGWQ